MCSVLCQRGNAKNVKNVKMGKMEFSGVLLVGLSADASAERSLHVAVVTTRPRIRVSMRPAHPAYSGRSGRSDGLA